jgi:hypothetical protein
MFEFFLVISYQNRAAQVHGIIDKRRQVLNVRREEGDTLLQLHFRVIEILLERKN